MGTTHICIFFAALRTNVGLVLPMLQLKVIGNGAMEVISYSPIGNKVNQTTILMKIMLRLRGRLHSGMIMVVATTRMQYVRRVTLYQLLFGPNVMETRVIIRLRQQCHGQKLINFAWIWVLNWLLYIRLKKIHFCIISVALRTPA